MPSRSSPGEVGALKVCMRSYRLATAVLFTFVVLPTHAAAQFGPVEAFLRNVTDLSFYGSVGRLFPHSDQLSSAHDVNAYGIEVLFPIGTIDRPVHGAEAPPRQDSVRVVWKGMEVKRSEGHVDTVYTYEVEAVPPRPTPERTIWTFEMGLGYGQMSGFRLRDPTLDLRGAVRDLPAASLYATYEPTGTYGGLRSGYMKTQGLQLITDSGDRISGSADAFLVGGALGEAIEVGAVAIFLESAYTVRYFPSVQWQAGTLPAGAPRDLGLSLWSISLGIQVSLRPG